MEPLPLSLSQTFLKRAMIVDLHAHYAMHVGPRGNPTRAALRSTERIVRDKVRYGLLQLAGNVMNYPSARAGPAVTIHKLKKGGVAVVFSPLYSPFDEMDVTAPYGALPRSHYFSTLLRQLDAVEATIAEAHADAAGVAHDSAELDALVAQGKVALIHAVEGGFHLGSHPSEISDNVKKLAARGVAYITVAHLFFRQVATNAPAVPFIPDALYRAIFPQDPSIGLTPLGHALVEAMIQQNVLVDLTHLGDRAIDDVFALMDARDPGRTIPVMVTHGAARGESSREYDSSDATIRRVAQRKGVIGLLLCRDYLCDGAARPHPSTLTESLELVAWHIDRVRSACGSHDHTAIGTDLDGFIEPVHGLDSPEALPKMKAFIEHRYGPEDAKKICSGNALRVLRAAWTGAHLPSTL